MPYRKNGLANLLKTRSNLNRLDKYFKRYKKNENW